MHRNCAHGIVQFEPALDPVVELVDDHDTDRADQHGLNRVVEVIAR